MPSPHEVYRLGGHESVFNLDTDPGEQADLMKADPEIMSQYRNMLSAWEQYTIELLWWWNKQAEEKYKVKHN